MVVLLILIDILTVGYPWTATVYCRKEEREKQEGGVRKEGIKIKGEREREGEEKRKRREK